LLWVSQFGFNGPQRLTPRAVLAITASHLAASAELDMDSAGMVEAGQAVGAQHDFWRGRRSWNDHGASGCVSPLQGVVIGVIAGAICFLACTAVKQRFGYDDLLDVLRAMGR
jgi:Amt family ammonium transporter